MRGNEEGKERVSGVEEHFGYKMHRTIDPSYSRLATKMHLQSCERPEKPPREEDSSLTLQTSAGKKGTHLGKQQRDVAGMSLHHNLAGSGRAADNGQERHSVRIAETNNIGSGTSNDIHHKLFVVRGN